MTQPGRARAAVGLTVLSTLEREYPELYDAVWAALAETTRSDYDTVATLRWVSMKSHMDLSDRVRDAIGHDNNADFWERASSELLNRPLLAYVQTFTKLMGPATRVFTRVTPVIMPQLFTGIGTFSVALVDDQSYFAVVSYDAFPASEHKLMCFVEGICGSLVAAGTVIGMRVEVTRLSVDPAGSFKLAVTELT